MDWASLFSGRPDRRTLPVARREDRYASTAGVNFDWKKARLPGGLLAEHRVNRFLIENLAPAGYAVEGDFDRLPIPFRAVATDLANGEPVVLAKGDLARAVRASMSIPLSSRRWSGTAASSWTGWSSTTCRSTWRERSGPPSRWRSTSAARRSSPQEYESALGVAAQVSDLLSAPALPRLPRRGRRARAPRPRQVTRRPTTRDSRADRGGLRGDEGEPAGDPREARRRRCRRRSRRGRAQAPAPSARGRADPRGPVARQRAGERGARPPHLQHPGRAGLRHAEQGLRAFDKVEAAGLFDHTWMEFDPVADGVRRRAARDGRAAQPGGGRPRVHRVGEGARLASGCATRTRSASASRSSCSLAASDAEGAGVGVAARRPPVRTPASGTACAAATAAGQAPVLRRGRATRSTGRGSSGDGRGPALRLLARALGARRGGGAVRQRGDGARRPGSTCRGRCDQVGALFGSVVGRHARRPGLAGARPQARRAAGAGACPSSAPTRPYWRLELEGRFARTLGMRVSRRSWTGSSGSRATTCPSTTGTAWAGSSSCPAITTRS